MRSTVIALSLAVLVTVVFSAPASSNMGNKQSEGASLSGNNGQRQEVGQSGCNSQSQDTNHSDNNERFQGGRHSASDNQSQGADHSDNNERFQGGRQSAGNGQFQGADHSGNNKRFQGAGQPGNNKRSPQVGRPAGDSHIQGFWPSDSNRTEETRSPHNRFNFHTDVPFNGIQDHSENVTEEPGFFGHHIFGNANQQRQRGKQHS